jgi:UDP-glucuronate decarboxylase
VEFAERIIRLTGSGSKIVYLPLPADDPRQRQPDITLAGKVLGWAPRVEVETGLRSTIDYFTSYLAALHN